MPTATHSATLFGSGNQLDVLSLMARECVLKWHVSGLFRLPLALVPPLDYNFCHLVFGNRGVNPLLPRNCNRGELNAEQGSGH